MEKNTLFKGGDLLASLTELALDLHWSWNHATDKVWRLLDPVLWELTHNPLVLLQTVSHNRISEVLADPLVREVVEELIQDRQQSSLAPAWFQKIHPNAPLTTVAYFSMEFMLSEALPIYSGGLGNVAGDHLKAASDLGVPVVGIGILFQRGYSRQVIHPDGSQQYVFPYNDPGQLPITPLRTSNGEWLRMEVKLPGYSVWVRTWKVQVGRVLLLLLDTNDPANFPVHRGITGELYGSDSELRFLQELVLGIGGCLLLKALGITPEVCHLNEGHSAFVVLERALLFMDEHNLPFETALAITRMGNVFTTHTAVGAGFDRFAPALIEQYLDWYIKDRLRITLPEFLALGRLNPHDASECFNTGYLAIKGSGSVNGVSKLHSQVSRQLFAPLFPRWPAEEVPVGHITNGVHMPTWDSPEADQLWTEACGKDRWLGTPEKLEQQIRCLPDARLWKMRCASEKTFIEYIRSRYARQLATMGMPTEEIEEVRKIFHPDVLTLGFARRFVTYKRPNLLLENPERLQRILTNPDQPVQLILAGKAHPGDRAGQALIKDWAGFINQYGLKQKVVFLSDYDMLLTEHMVQGVDLWINTPQRPWEACGTSGMKVLVNGGLNVSELDGWWDEAYDPCFGWAIGDRTDHRGDPRWDKAEAEKLYSLLEQEIIPAFYTRNEEGIPVGWVKRMRESMARLTPLCSVSRSLPEYTEKCYLPAAAAYMKRAADNGALGKQVVDWCHCFEKKWGKLHFGKLAVETKGEQHYFRVEVFLNDFHSGEVSVELYADEISGSGPIKQKMNPMDDLSPASGPAVFTATVPADRPAGHFTPRVIPVNESLAVPLEFNPILWYD
jgi:glycogen phosphorylase